MQTRSFKILVAICALSIPIAGSRAQTTDSAAAYDWDNVPILGGGFVSGLLFHPTEPDLLYARTDVGGLYRWNESARRWIPLTDCFGGPNWTYTGIESVAIDPTDPNRLYAAVGTYTNDWSGNGAILRSSDRGNNWAITQLPFKNGGNEGGRNGGERLVVDPNLPSRLLFGTRNNGLWTSSDSGATWSLLPSFPIQTKTNGVGLNFVVFDATSGKADTATPVIYASVQDTKSPALYRSKDSGATWSIIPNPAAGTLLAQHAKLSPDGRHLYVTYGNNAGPNGMGNGAVMCLDTQTDAWHDLTPEKPGEGNGFGYSGVSLDASNPNTLVVSTVCRWGRKDEIFRSIDAGKTWKPMIKGAGWASDAPYALKHSPHWTTDVEIDPNQPDRAWFVTGYGVWATRNATAPDRGEQVRWSFDNHGLEECVVLDLAAPPAGDAIVLSSMYDQDGFRHTSLQQPPAGPYQPSHNNSDILEFAELSPNLILRRHPGAIRLSLSADNGATWAELPTVPPTPSKAQKCGRPAISANGETILWPQGDDVAYRTTNRGATWSPVSGVPAGSTVTADRADPTRFYAVDPSGRVLISTDAGLTFSDGAALGASAVRLWAVPGHVGRLFAIKGGKLLQSTDGGKSFAPTGDLQPGTIGLGMPAPGTNYPTIFATGTLNNTYGIYRSTDAGKTWTRINDDRHQFAHIHTIAGDPRVFGRLFLGSGSRGVIVGILKSDSK